MPHPDESSIVSYRQATREELDQAVAFAAAEGWNPGIDDANIFWETDPKGFVVAERDGKVIATGSIVSYGDFGFLGFFIVVEELRHQGIGRAFWNWRKQTLQDRLKPGAAIGMDGVLDMQAFYARGGFEFTHRNLRMEGLGQASALDESVRELTGADLGDVEAMDRRCFGFERKRFLARWIQPRNGVALGAFADNRLKAFGVVRQCEVGFKIGPLFADDAAHAQTVFAGLSSHAAGEAVFLDVPENNPAALALAEKNSMTEVFGCARMYAGPAPDLPWSSIYGVTTFELG